MESSFWSKGNNFLQVPDVCFQGIKFVVGNSEKRVEHVDKCSQKSGQVVSVCLAVCGDESWVRSCSAPPLGHHHRHDYLQAVKLVWRPFGVVFANQRTCEKTGLVLWIFPTTQKSRITQCQLPIYPRNDHTTPRQHRNASWTKRSSIDQTMRIHCNATKPRRAKGWEWPRSYSQLPWKEVINEAHLTTAQPRPNYILCRVRKYLISITTLIPPLSLCRGICVNDCFPLKLSSVLTQREKFLKTVRFDIHMLQLLTHAKSNKQKEQGSSSRHSSWFIPAPTHILKCQAFQLKQFASVTPRTQQTLSPKDKI